MLGHGAGQFLGGNVRAKLGRGAQEASNVSRKRH